MLLTDDQLFEIQQIIRDHHHAFIVNHIAVEAVAPQILEGLKAKGLVDVKIKSIEDAYVYGQLLALMDDPKVAHLSAEQFRQYVRKHPVPLSEIERRAVAMAQHEAAQYVVGLGNKVDQQTGQLLIEADAALRAKLQTTIQEKAAENIERRESVEQLKSDLGWASQDWTRDWNRIAVTEKQLAMQAGVRDSLRGRYGKDVLVAKVPMPDACPHCKRLHLGPDGAPRIFKLSTLEKNGQSNYGRKVADWKPVTGAVHPHCSCALVRVPPGWGFNEEGQLEPGGKLGVQYKNEAELAMAYRQEDDLRKSKRERVTAFQGIPIMVENEPGSERHWKTAEGEAGTTRMLYLYGYIPGTDGADDDNVDVFVGPRATSPAAFIVHQQNPKNGMYDEDKVMLGFADEAAATAAYHAHYNRPDFFAGVTTITVDQLKRVLGTPRIAGSVTPLKRGKPVMPHVLTYSVVKSERQADLSAESTSQAVNRVPGPGTMANYLFRAPARPAPVDMSETMKEVLVAQQRQNESFKRDRDIYKINTHPHKLLPIGRPMVESGLDKEQIAGNREGLDEAARARTAEDVKNWAEIDPETRTGGAGQLLTGDDDDDAGGAEE